jgi:O-acetylserine/cysteine efflux transporter
MFAALRFTAALLPAVLFIPRPSVPWRNLAAYGLLIGVGQFGILFIAMNGQITPALASLVVQTQVFFTVALAAYQNGERVRPFQFVALTITTIGLVLIMAHTDASTTPLGLALVLLAALSWAFGNMVIRSTPDADMLGYVVWASLFSIPPLLAASFLFDGWPAIRDGIAHADAATWGAVLWQGWGNTLFGFAMWGWLLGRYPVAAIAPTSLLVPVFGLAASAFWLSEPLQAWKLEATALVLLGLIINFTWPKIAAARRARAAGATA